jgi:hypothetical protein
VDFVPNRVDELGKETKLYQEEKGDFLVVRWRREAGWPRSIFSLTRALLLFYRNPPRSDIGVQIIFQGIGAIFRFWAPATLWKTLKVVGTHRPVVQNSYFSTCYASDTENQITSVSQIKLTNRTTARRIQSCHMWISTGEKDVKNNNKNRKLLHLDLT